jgi:hypothetical protein
MLNVSLFDLFVLNSKWHNNRYLLTQDPEEECSVGSLEAPSLKTIASVNLHINNSKRRCHRDTFIS